MELNTEITQRLEIVVGGDRFNITHNGIVIGEPRGAKIPVALLRKEPALTESELWRRCSYEEDRKIWEKLARQTLLFDSMHNLLKAVAENSVARNSLSTEEVEQFNSLMNLLEKQEVKDGTVSKG